MRRGAILMLMASLIPEPAATAARPEQETAGRAVADLAGAHNLQPGSAARAGTCSFCHTPEGSPGAAPRWARTAADSAYAAFDSRGADGGIRVSGPTSVACLVCHDGVQAPEISAGVRRGAPAGGGAGDSHPVGVPFTGDAQLPEGDATERPRLQREVVGDRESWWLDLERVPNGVRDKSDAILFVRGDGTASQPFVECATCHDPHAATGRVMLRNPDAGSGLCLACHNL